MTSLPLPPAPLPMPGAWRATVEGALDGGRVALRISPETTAAAWYWLSGSARAPNRVGAPGSGELALGAELRTACGRAVRVVSFGEPRHDDLALSIPAVAEFVDAANWLAGTLTLRCLGRTETCAAPSLADAAARTCRFAADLLAEHAGDARASQAVLRFATDALAPLLSAATSP